jgi:hypothetical protein
MLKQPLQNISEHFKLLYCIKILEWRTKLFAFHLGTIGGVISMLRQGSVQITLTEAQRKMVVRSLATTMENLRSHPGESLLNFEFREWMELIGQFATAEETSKFVPSLCKYRSICPHVINNNRER